MSDKVVTRFAPSPTGYLHVGGARTALFSWLLARHAGGEYLLRIEDTDRARSTTESVNSVLEDLRWLGLNWDNPQLVFQSQRLEIYNAIIADLMKRQLAYKAFETPQELDAQRRLAERARRPFIYKRPTLTDEQIRKYESEGRPSVIRFAMAVREYRFTDVVLGKEIVLGADQVQDFIIRKTDGMPTFHFAVVVDDAEMGITHVLRGQEHLLNTVNHIALQEALGYPRPIYAHLSVILNTDGSKISKRDQDKFVRGSVREVQKLAMQGKRDPAWANSGKIALGVEIEAERFNDWLADDNLQLSPEEHARILHYLDIDVSKMPEILVHDFRANGYLPEVLLNFLALLGWSPGGDVERMSIGEMVQNFSLERVGQANAKFNREKLLAFNTESLAAEGATQLIPAMRDFLAINPDSPLSNATAAQLEKVIEMNAGMHTLREAEHKSRFLFLPDEAIQYSSADVEKILLKNDRQGLAALAGVRNILADLADWDAPSLEAAVKSYCESSGLPLGKVAQPIRVAISGGAVSPPIFQSLALLGHESTLDRIDRCLSFVQQSAAPAADGP